MKRNTKAQWTNLQQNSSFVNRTRFPLLCEKSGAIPLMLVGLMAADEILVDSKIIKFSTDRTVRIFTVFGEGTVLS